MDMRRMIAFNSWVFIGGDNFYGVVYKEGMGWFDIQ